MARSLETLRTRRSAVATLGAALGATALAAHEAGAKKKKKHHKRKKTCAQKCQDGCCTSKFGSCVRPGAQSGGQCGTGGEICHGGCPECTANRPCPEGQCCDGDGACGPCLVFVSSSTHQGDLGGLDGADDICQGLAEAAGKPGTYRAWLSDDTGSPSTRFIRATAPYVRVDGEIVANSYDDLTDGSNLNRAINLTETGIGGALAPNQVWTSTGDDGQQQLAPDNCDGWTNGTAAFNGDFGLKSSISPAWTGSDFRHCDLVSRIYCFQQT
jgi:hypothetical protein